MDSVVVPLPVNAWGWLAASWLALLALRWGAAPRLAALRETSILFGTAIAVVFLKERLTRSRSVGIVSIALAAVVLIASG